MTDQELVERFYTACAEFNETSKLMIAAGVKVETSITYSDGKVFSETVKIKEINPTKAEKVVLFIPFVDWKTQVAKLPVVEPTPADPAKK